MITTLQVKINSTSNVYGCVRSEGSNDRMVEAVFYTATGGRQSKTTFKVIINGSYCAVMYLFILES